jgi:predicted ATP-dependent serine protease
MKYQFTLLFLGERVVNAAENIVTIATMEESTRPILLEVQALTLRVSLTEWFQNMMQVIL